MNGSGAMKMGVAVVGFGLVFGGFALLGDRGPVTAVAADVKSPAPEEPILPAEPAPKPEAEEAKSELTAELKIGTGIKDRELTGEDGTFVFKQGELGRLYCWSRIQGAKGETSVTHLWYLGDKKIAEVPLSVKSASFRTWSAKWITDKMVGKGQVEVRDANGLLVGRAAFEVLEPLKDELQGLLEEGDAYDGCCEPEEGAAAPQALHGPRSAAEGAAALR